MVVTTRDVSNNFADVFIERYGKRVYHETVFNSNL